MIVLVDTPIWSLLFRRRDHDLAAAQHHQLQRLREIVASGSARLLGAVRQELLTGIRSSQQFARLKQELRSFPNVKLQSVDYETAAAISNACRVHGIAGGPVDFLLCSVALRRNWSIFTADRDFENYARHIPITLFH